MTPEQFAELKDALAPTPQSSIKKVTVWLGIAGGIVAVFVALWQFGDGLFSTEAEAATERATRVAAETLIEARAAGDLSAKGLAGYEKRLRSSFIWSYMEAFRQMPELLENPDLFTRYPAEICGFLRELVHLDRRHPRRPARAA